MKQTPAQICKQRLEFYELVKDIRALGVSVIPELRFHQKRKWRFDLGFPDLRVALEIEGLGGRHQFTGGFVGDIENYGEAFALGWNVLRVTRKDVGNGTALRWLSAYLSGVKNGARGSG